MLDIDIWNFVWALVNIAILFIVLRIFLFKPINKIMDERTKSIQNDIDSAKKSKEEAEELKEKYSNALAEAREEGQQLIVKAREEANAAKQEILADGEEEARQMIDKANKTIENERRKTIQEARSYVADLAIAAASKIVGENVDDDKNRRLVDDFLEEEGALNNDGE